MSGDERRKLVHGSRALSRARRPDSGVPPDGKQRLPDYVNDIASGSEAQAKAAAAGWKGAPREDHDILAWAMDTAIGRHVNVFFQTLTMEAILFELSRRRPVILSGIFGSYVGKADGQEHARYHVVCATGIESDQEDLETATLIDPAKVAAVLVADPWGDYHTNYASEDGAECRFGVDELVDILHDMKAPTKWAHVMVTPQPASQPSPVQDEKTGAEAQRGAA